MENIIRMHLMDLKGIHVNARNLVDSAQDRLHKPWDRLVYTRSIRKVSNLIFLRKPGGFQ